ncbi:MAG: M20/M25/M40 family metallo-hydrolase [Chitinophagaceae bacterium]|nr:MAG: M20/M25/M40 family metallo-hydrolase [Chitinophagaceae bacterium]
MQHDRIDILQADAVNLLKELISTPSFSKEEDQTAGILCRFLGERGIIHYRVMNNVYAFNEHYNKDKPSVLLNSHHDTVKPNKGYTLDPFTPVVKEGKLYGLGSNDAGGCLVSLIATFLYYYHREDLPFNLVLAASAEEEISGFNGIELLLKDLGPISFGIVGEPTQMQMAIAEKGLLVLDVNAEGKAGHAAREEGDNAIYKTLKDIQWFSTYRYPKNSELLGPVKMSVTVIETENKAHNVVPSGCHFVVDVRVNELYTFEEVLRIIQSNTSCTVTPRSLRMRSSYISLDHPIVKAGIKLGRSYYGSPTTSDKALMPFNTLKMGPGDSARSHTADEYIFLTEINDGIELYIQFIKELI